MYPTRDTSSFFATNPSRRLVGHILWIGGHKDKRCPIGVGHDVWASMNYGRRWKKFCVLRNSIYLCNRKSYSCAKALVPTKVVYVAQAGLFLFGRYSDGISFQCRYGVSHKSSSDRIGVDVEMSKNSTPSESCISSRMCMNSFSLAMVRLPRSVAPSVISKFFLFSIKEIDPRITSTHC